MLNALHEHLRPSDSFAYETPQVFIFGGGQDLHDVLADVPKC